MFLSCLALLLMIWTVLRRNIVALSFCFLFVAFGWRLVSAIYIDWAGPVFASEIGRDIFSASAAQAYGLAVLMTLVAWIVVLRPRAFSDALRAWQPRPRNQGMVSLGNLFFLAMSLFVAGMYVDLIARGNIPIFSCLERYEYAQLHAGSLHRAYFKYGALMALQLGVFTVYPRIQGGVFSWRFLGIVGALFCYGLLTGERYSGFYKLVTFYAMPFAAILVLRKAGRLPPSEGGGAVARMMARPTTWLGLLVLVTLLVAAAIAHSYINVRSDRGYCAALWQAEKAAEPTPVKSASLPKPLPSDAQVVATAPAVVTPEDIESTSTVAQEPSEPKDVESGAFDPSSITVKLLQRVLVQPSQMWFVTWSRVVEQGDWRPDWAARFMFDIPTAFDGNKGVRYLMLREMGEHRAAELKSQGSQVAGGYPEVLFELLGPWLAWPSIALVGILTAWLLRKWLVSMIHGRLFTAFFAGYVLYAFFILYVGGMTNFLVAYTFWGKVILFLFFWRMEPALLALGDRWQARWLLHGKTRTNNETGQHG